MTEHIVALAALVLAAGATVIQVSPLQINPWSAVGRAIGRFIGVESMRESLERHIRLDDERFAKQCRTRILRFNDELLQDKKHSKEHFDETLDDITEYERYCETHPGYRNSKASMAIANVEAVYQRRLRDKDFL